MPPLQRPPLARSYLYAPGNVERILQKVFSVGADAVVLDLEDAVPPAEKPVARQMVAEVLKHRKKLEWPRIFVRINSISSVTWREDLRAVVQPSLYGIRVPKVESEEQMQMLDSALSEAEDRAGLDRGSVRVGAALETAIGILAAYEIAKNPRIESLGFGYVDFMKDIGVEPDPFGLQTLFVQSYVVLVSRAAGLIPPSGSVYPQVGNLEGLRATTEAAKRLGFYGRSCIHPSQIPVVHQVFTPSPSELAQARAIIEAFDRAVNQGRGAIVVGDGVFVDKPIAERAHAVISLAENLERREEAKGIDR